MADYPVLDGNDGTVIAEEKDPAYVAAPYDNSADYPVRDGEGDVVVETANPNGFQITATITPATSAISSGQTIADMTNYAAMTAPGNFLIDGVAVSNGAWITVTFQGDAVSAATAIGENESAGFTVTVDDGTNPPRSFVASPYTVPDVTAPILSSASATLVDHDAVALAFSTDEANGSAYAVATTSATQPSVAQIKAGQDHTGAAATASSSQVVSSTGAQADIAFTGLPAGNLYFYLLHEDDAGNASAIYASDVRVTEVATITAGTDPVMGALVDGDALATETGTDGAYSSNVTGETFVDGVDGATIVVSYEIEGPPSTWTATTAAVSENDVIRKSVVVTGSEGTTATFTSASITVGASVSITLSSATLTEGTGGTPPSVTISYTYNGADDLDCLVAIGTATEPTPAQIIAGTGGGVIEVATFQLGAATIDLADAFTAAVDGEDDVWVIVKERTGSVVSDVVGDVFSPAIDATVPTLSGIVATAGDTTASIAYSTSEDNGDVFYLSQDASATAPVDADAVISGADASVPISSIGAQTALALSSLANGTARTTYFAYRDDWGNKSPVYDVDYTPAASGGTGVAPTFEFGAPSFAVPYVGAIGQAGNYLVIVSCTSNNSNAESYDPISGPNITSSTLIGTSNSDTTQALTNQHAFFVVASAATDVTYTAPGGTFGQIISITRVDDYTATGALFGVAKVTGDGSLSVTGLNVPAHAAVVAAKFCRGGSATTFTWTGLLTTSLNRTDFGAGRVSTSAIKQGAADPSGSVTVTDNGSGADGCCLMVVVLPEDV